MIKIECDKESLKKSTFEFYRMKFKEKYKNLDDEIYIDINKKYLFLKILDREKIIEKTFEINENSKLHFIVNKFLFDLYKDRDDFDKSYGILTGVRPLKLVSKVFKDNNIEDSINILYENYRIDEFDSRFLYKIYLNQINIRMESEHDNYNVYVHIPFCPSRCFYCSFDTTIKNKIKMDKYTENICKDINNYELNINQNPHSIYIGGGTPTAIGLENLEKIVKSIKNKFGEAQEFTVECGRIDSLSVEILEMLKNNGVNRISLNPQTFNDEVLNRLNRVSNKDFKYWFDLAKEIGFEIINMDLIMGLPEEDIEMILNSIRKTIEFNPDNITIHTLALKNGSKLFENHYLNKEDYENLLKESKNLLTSNGYNPYYLYRQKKSIISSENIGYAKGEKSSIYNIVMMEEIENIIGFGLGASTKILNSKGRFERNINSKNLEDFIKE